MASAEARLSAHNMVSGSQDTHITQFLARYAWDQAEGTAVGVQRGTLAPLRLRSRCANSDTVAESPHDFGYWVLLGTGVCWSPAVARQGLISVNALYRSKSDRLSATGLYVINPRKAFTPLRKFSSACSTDNPCSANRWI